MGRRRPRNNNETAAASRPRYGCIGNPQNILIATSRDLGFTDFLGALAVPAIASLLLAYAFVSILYHKDLAEKRASNANSATVAVKGRQATMVFFWAFGAPVALGALAGIAILPVTRRIRPDRIFAEVDWTLLVLFAGLFVITKAVAGTASYRALMALTDAGMDGPSQT